MSLTTFAIDGFAFQRASPEELPSLLQNIPQVSIYQDSEQWWNVRTEELCLMEQCQGYDAILLPTGEEIHVTPEGREYGPVICTWVKDEKDRFFPVAALSAEVEVQEAICTPGNRERRA